MPHIKKNIFGKNKSCNGVDISDMIRFFSCEEQGKIRNNPDILKIIQEFPRSNKKADDCKRRKGVHRNETHNN